MRRTIHPQRKPVVTQASPKSKRFATPRYHFITLNSGVGEDSESDEIVDLTEAEYAALKRAAPRNDILMFVANAALEKAGFKGETA